jgi:hypothetical protein
LIGLVATAARWGTENSDQWWRSVIERFAQPIRDGSGMSAWLSLPNVPASMMLRAAQVAAAAGDRYVLLLGLFTEGRVFNPFKGDFTSMQVALEPHRVYEGLGGAPLRLFDALTPVFVDHLLLDDRGWVEAWETVDLLHLVEATYRLDRDNGFAHLNAREQPKRPDQPQNRLGMYGLTVSVRGNEHIRVDDAGRPNYAPVVGQRLAGDAAQLAALAKAGFCGADIDALTYTLNAVNWAIAKKGDTMAWRHVFPQGGFGIVPGYIWLDTGERPAF